VDLSAGSGKLNFVLKTLRARWETTKLEWTDQVRQDFEHDHLQSLEADVTATLTAINTLGQILTKARQECT
jgi:hypothetical protein